MSFSCRSSTVASTSARPHTTLNGPQTRLERLIQTPAVTRQNTVSTMSPRNAPITNSHSRSDTLRKFFSPFRSAVCSCRAAAG